jgi:hypothetical protein
VALTAARGVPEKSGPTNSKPEGRFASQGNSFLPVLVSEALADSATPRRDWRQVLQPFYVSAKHFYFRPSTIRIEPDQT